MNIKISAEDITLIREKSIETSVKSWLKDIVIKLNLCPFAKAEMIKNRIRYAISKANNTTLIVEDLINELDFLETNPDTATTLIILPYTLLDFLEFNGFLELAENVVRNKNLEGIYQIASFHPDYQFENTHYDDAENYSNRSPYPILHLLREDDITNAVNTYPNAEDIPNRNIETLNKLGKDACMNALLKVKSE